jgi:hypothetical protein
MLGQRANLLPLGVKFDGFLFASISETEEGRPLSVISALTRLELDPWEEAATLARLPAGVAILRLVSTLGSLHVEMPSQELHTAAIRLVALLPSKIAPESTPSQQLTTSLTAKTKILALVGGLLMVVMIVFSFFTAPPPSRSQPGIAISKTESRAPSRQLEMLQGGQ